MLAKPSKAAKADNQPALGLGDVPLAAEGRTRGIRGREFTETTETTPAPEVKSVNSVLSGRGGASLAAGREDPSQGTATLDRPAPRSFKPPPAAPHDCTVQADSRAVGGGTGFA